MSDKTDLNTLLKTMNPTLHDGEYVFCAVNALNDTDINDIVLFFREEEAVTIIISKETAIRLNLKFIFIAAWITLTVNSSLEAVGFTAVFSNALSQKGISCNVVAGYYHDHIFVNSNDAEKAMEILANISG
jgi:uncharacterized protein